MEDRCPPTEVLLVVFTLSASTSLVSRLPQLFVRVALSFTIIFALVFYSIAFLTVIFSSASK